MSKRDKGMCSSGIACVWAGTRLFGRDIECVWESGVRARERERKRELVREGEEERATTVPNREGKAKSRWTVASLPWYTKRCPGLQVLSEIVQKESSSSH